MSEQMCHCGTFNLTVYNRRDNSYLDTSGFIHTKATCPDIPLTALTAERDKYRDACERLIGHYGVGESPDGIWPSDSDFARQVKAELEGMEGSEIEVVDE